VTLFPKNDTSDDNISHLSETPFMTGQKGKQYPSLDNIDEIHHTEIVKDIFSTIVSRYDTLNRLFSLRRDISWRTAMIREMRFFQTHRLLDIATGTADVAIGAARQHRDISIVGIDLVEEMLQKGAEKIQRTSYAHRIALVRADALMLPFGENTFDTASIAFGIRNIHNRETALKEMIRVVVPGGRILILEMNLPQNRIIRKFYRFYLEKILPRASKHLSKNPAAYQYLAESILKFPSPQQFVRFMETNGLSDVTAIPLSGGITYLYTANVPVNGEVGN